MKICVFCHDHKLSGANLSLFDWLEDAKNGNNSYIIVLPRNNRTLKKQLKEKGFDVITSFYIPVHKTLFKTTIRKRIILLLKKTYALLFNRIAYYILYKRISKLHVDIIHSNSFSIVSGAYVSKKLGIPHVWHIREFMEEDHQISHYNNNLIKEYCNYSFAIFISDVIAKKYLSMYSFKGHETIYNKIKYDDCYNKTRRFMEDGICNIIIVGTISDNKGQLDAIKCIQKLNADNKKAKLYICGDGPTKEKYIRYVDNENISNVEFMGFKSDVTSIRKNMDIALMCSRSEALGRVTIEALYYENLLIGANCGCTPYIIKDGINGFLYNPDNIEELYEKVLYAINNKSEIESIIEESKALAIEKYSKSILSRIENIYEQNISSNTN